MKKILLSLIAVAMSTISFAQDWVGTQFEIAAGGNCTMEAPVEAERYCEFQGKWGSITPSITSFSDEVYSKVVINFAEALDTYYNVPYKNAEGTQGWNASSTNGEGATSFTIDIKTLHSITDLFIQNVSDTKHSFTITEAYAEKLTGEKVPLAFTAGWNASIMVKGVKNGNPAFGGQWASLNISNDIIGKIGKKVLRIYTKSDFSEAPVQWCVKTAAGADRWPQINKSANYGECTINDNLASIVLQWTSTEAGSIDIAAITWEVIPFVSATLNAEGYATYSADVDLKIITDDVKAYKAVVEGETITLTELDGDIPAGTGVILYGKPGTKVEFDAATATAKAETLSDNSLKATTTSEKNIISKPEGTIWALGSDNQFQKYTGSEFIANRAFLIHETSGAKMRVVFADDATGISEIKSSQNTNSKIIENGKVVIVKNGVKYNVSGQLIK